MADLDETVVNEGQPAFHTTDELFKVAWENLEKVLKRQPMPVYAYGSRGIVREGDKRQVHYLEVPDPNGIVLRVEVFYK